MEFSINSKIERGSIVCEIIAPEANEFTQYAYYLYGENDVVLEKQGYINSSTFSFLLTKSGNYCVKGFVKYKNNLKDEYQKKSKKSKMIPFYSTKKIRYEDLKNEPFRESEPIIYEILWDEVKFEFLINYKESSNQAVVFGTGDVGNVSRSLWPRFDRNTWAKDIKANAIYYFDPTVYLGDTSLGWGYGTEKKWYIENIAVLILEILKKWGITMENTLFYGSSAGGYTAILLAILLHGKATVINPQLIIPNFWPNLYKKFVEIVTSKNEPLKEERLYITKVVQREAYFPQIHLIQNMFAKRDIQTQLAPFLNEMAELEIDCKDKLQINFYTDLAGNNGMPSKEECLRMIKEDLNKVLLNTNSIDNQNENKTFLKRYQNKEFFCNQILKLSNDWSNEDDKKLYLVITIDTEDKCGNVPNLFECDFGEEGNCGVNYIMEQLEQRGMRGVFFTNIYEHLNYKNEYEGYIEKLLNRISNRGHEIGLHAHAPNYTMDFYKDKLTNYDFAGQFKILKYGTDFIKKNIGKNPIAFRGGAYACDDTTLRIMSDLGYKIESSSFYGDSPKVGNKFQYYRSLNQVVPIYDFLEFPVIIAFNSDGKLKKFDVNQLNEDEMIAIVKSMKTRPYFNATQIMLHSFSFLDQKGTPDITPKFIHGSHAGYGVNKELMERFEKFLDYLRDDPDIEVVTFEEYLKIAPKVAPIWGEGVFHTGSIESQNAAKKFIGVRTNARNKDKQIIGFETKKDIEYATCSLPRPTMYFSLIKSETYAKDLLEGKLWVYPHIESMLYDINEFDWNVQFSNIPRTFQLYLQALNPIQILTAAFEESRNSKYLEYAYKFIISWKNYSSYEENWKGNIYTWNDHAVALRAENLMYFGKVCSSIGIWSDDFYDSMYGILKMHGDWLFDDAHYTKRHNHGIIQDQALLHLGFVLKETKWIEHAKNRLLEQQKWAFNEEMVHTENSPGYANHVSSMLKKIGEFLDKNQDSLGKKLIEDMKKTQEYMDWTIKPNGIVAQVGDTGNTPGKIYGSEEKMQRKTEEIHKFYSKAGIYFYRSNQDEEHKLDTWKMVKSGYVQTTHKHADDCSFMLYSKGQEIFVDGGIYGYTKDDFRKYFVSAKAHNSIIVDDNSYICDAKRMDLIGVKGYQFFENYDHIRMFNNAYDGVVWERDFCSADDLTIIMDSIASEELHTYSQVFHLSENVEIIKHSDEEVVLKLNESGFYVRLHQFGEPTKLSIIYGNKSEANYGLISRAENHLDTITTLKFDLVGKFGIFATAITIEDSEGKVRLGNSFKKAKWLKYLSKEKTFILDNLVVSCRSDLTYSN